MRNIAIQILAASALLMAGGAQAQSATNTTAPPAGVGAGMGYGMGHGMGRGAGHGMGAGMGGGQMRAGPGYTMGWSMMTPEERMQNRNKMMSFTSAKECRAYVEQHHQLMVARAKARGMAMPAAPMHDPCAGLKN